MIPSLVSFQLNTSRGNAYCTSTSYHACLHKAWWTTRILGSLSKPASERSRISTFFTKVPQKFICDSCKLKMKDKDNNFKDVTVRRQNVADALH